MTRAEVIMHSRRLRSAGIIAAFTCVATLAGLAQTRYPQSRKADTADIYFGTKVADPYRWMEDLNSPEFAEFVEEFLGPGADIFEFLFTIGPTLIQKIVTPGALGVHVHLLVGSADRGGVGGDCGEYGLRVGFGRGLSIGRRRQEPARGP